MSASWVFGVGIALQSSGRRLRRFCISLEINVEKKLSSRRARRRCYALRDEMKNKCSFISVVIQCGFTARATFATLTKRGTRVDEKWSLVVAPCFEPFSIGQLALGLYLDSERYFSEFGSVASGLATARLPALWLARPFVRRICARSPMPLYIRAIMQASAQEPNGSRDAYKQN